MTPPPLMQGFPPAADTQVTLANWRRAPWNRWAFHHVREIVPSADIPNAPQGVRALPAAPDGSAALAGVRIEAEPADGGALSQAMDLDAFLQATDTDALVVLRHGRLVFEHYANGMDAHDPHILMSVSKSLLGIVAGQLADRGVLDPSRPVTHWIPEVAQTAYRGATLRELLDMRVGVLFDEDYLATSGPIIEYRKAQGWNPPDPGQPPGDLRSFFGCLTATDGGHGERFHYVSPNTDLLGWVIERASGRRYADLVSELLWRPMGAERSAYITVDRLGAPRAAGGFCATARDLARVGQLLVDGGTCDGRQVLSPRWIEDLADGGDAAAWARGDFVGYFPGLPMRYRNQWYVLDGPRPMLFCVGVHGQNLFVDRAAGIVIAKMSSQALPMDAPRLTLTMRGIDALRRHLAGG